MTKVTRKRHFLKTITWRFVASLDTMLIGWILTGKISIGAGIAGMEILTKMILYYLHERAWYRFTKFGIKKKR